MSDYNTDLAPGLSTGLGEAPKPAPPPPTDTELDTALFHTQNSLGSVIQRMSRGSYTAVPGYNPVDDLKGWADPEYLRNHGSTFLGSQSPQETQAIKAEIDQGQKDRAAIAASGWNGTVAGLRMGLVDPTMFLPMGNAVRLARAATVGGRAADVGLSVGKVALMQSTAQEALLQASQPERTLSEGAINVGSSTLLASLIGGGGYALLAREGLLDKGLGALDQARVKLSQHIEAYHGSPHDFDAFDVSKIGSGEGAQAYGHGLYFAESEGVARSYQAALSDSQTVDGKKYNMYDPTHVAAAQVGESGSREAAIRDTEARLKGDPDPEGFISNVLRILKKGEALPEFKDTGNLYRVKITADKESMLDLDKPLNEQATPVQEAVKRAMGVDYYGNFDAAKSERLWSEFEGANAKTAVRQGFIASDDKLVAQRLSDSGIPGLKYLDDNSRKAGEGTRNFVVFNDKHVEITHKNGEPVNAEIRAEQLKQATPAAGTGMALAAGAAPSDTRNLSPVPFGLDSIPGVGKAVSKMFPNLDVLTNSVHPAKAALSEMVDTPIALMANREGQTATRFGGPTIERELKQMREGLHWQADQEVMKQWGSYLDQGEGGATFMQRQTGQGPAGKMSFDDFNAAVYDALSTGDQHPTPQVAAAAQWIRKNGLDPIKERALAAIDGFKETTSRPGETYAPRNWDKDKISANWNDYVGTWTDHLEAEQITKAQAKTRIEGLAKKLSEAGATIDNTTAKLAKMKQDDLFRGGHEEELIRANAVHDQARKQIEEEIAAWEGKTTAEAKSALKARAKAEEARAPDAKRLNSADKAVDKAVKRIIESDRDLSRQELKARAEEIASRVIGTPEGRLPYDTDSTTGAVGPGDAELRGHAAHREIDIPYEMAKPWLRRSATESLKSYTHSVLPDTLLAERFDGDPNLTAVMKEIESAYAAKRAEAKSDTAQNKLKSQMDTDIKNVAAMRDRIRGTFAYDPTMQGLARFSQNALKVNNIISSHGMAVASLPDFAGVVFRHGIESAFKDAWVPFAASVMDNEAWQAVKAAGDEWKAFGIGIESHSASRNHALSDIAEHYRPNSKFERALTWLSDKAFIANLLAPLTDIQKRMATNAVASNILRSAEAVAGGKASAKQIQRLAEGNITEAQAARIWDQWSNNGGERVKGIILPNMDKWTDKGAASAFRGAVGRDVDISVVQPGYGEIPKFMSKPGFNVLVQYKKFTMSATQRILISNLQRHDAGSVAGLVTAVGMGMLAYRINSMAAGQKTSDRVQDWVKEGVSRGGVLGVIDDSNSIVSKATGGKADIYRLMGADKPLSKYVSVDAASMFLGPSYGKLTNFMKVARGATHPSEWNEADSHALRMMTMGTNFPYLPQLFDKVEAGANHAFGIPMKAKPQ